MHTYPQATRASGAVVRRTNIASRTLMKDNADIKPDLVLGLLFSRISELLRLARGAHARLLFVATALAVLGTAATAHGQITAAQLFRNSYRVYEGQRTAIGVYRDSTVFSGAQYHPGSTANIGVGLVSLCIAHRMGWDPNARAKVIQTLQTTVVGAQNGANYFWIDRNAAGFHRHFFSLATGAQAWDSEYSTVDTAILVSGALFAKKYFANGDVSYWADRLYNEVNWSKAIANAATGQIYLTLDANGNGIPGSVTSTFNEYMIVANLARRSENGGGGPATTLWNNYYGNINNLLKRNYWGHSTLTDSTTQFVSSFVPQFNYYFCNPFSSSSMYRSYMTNAMNADKLWFSNAGGAQSYQWGLGAGNTPAGYHADKIDDNVYKVVSPQIIAGYIPRDNSLANTLVSLHANNRGVYMIGGYPILWRHSITNPSWRAPDVQGIDFSTMLFGLASLPANCGAGFFNTNNNYDFPPYAFAKSW